MTIRVLVVDDQALVRAGLGVILGAEPDIEVVGEAADGLEAVDVARRVRPDVVLMDIRVPGLDGLEATRRILDAPSPPTRVMILTTFDTDEHVFDALRAGASGFLLKDAARDQLVSAVRVVAAGEALLAPSLTRRLVEEYARRPAPATQRAAASLESLTAREREVLIALARGLSNGEMAHALFVGEATVKSHVAHVLMKLGLRDRVQAVIFAYEAGVVRPGE